MYSRTLVVRTRRDCQNVFELSGFIWQKIDGTKKQFGGSMIFELVKFDCNSNIFTPKYFYVFLKKLMSVSYNFHFQILEAAILGLGKFQ